MKGMELQALLCVGCLLDVEKEGRDWVGRLEVGGYTPWVRESVCKRMKGKGLRRHGCVGFGDGCVVTSCKTLQLEGGATSPVFCKGCIYGR